MRTLAFFPSRHAVALQPRFAHSAITAYSKDGDGNPSKCPFFGGPNGGGIGDANIVTYALFVAAVVLLRILLIKLLAVHPRRLLAALLLYLPRAATA